MQVLAQLERAHKRGEHGRVVFTCDQLLANPSYDPLRAPILFWKGMSRLKSGHVWHGEAITCFREGIAAAGKDRPTKGRLLVALGHVYALMGDYAAFEKLIKEWERISRDREPAVMRWGAPFWYNYGCTLDNAFRYADSIKVYTRAISLGEYVSSVMLGDCWHNLGGAYLYSGHLPEALEAMERAEALLTDETHSHKKLSRRAEYAHAAGDLVSAQQYITEALLCPQVDDMTRADVYYTWSQVLLDLGRLQEAQEKALKALDYAVKDAHLPGIHKTNAFLQRFDPLAR
jgi:tetratricopeptide (TPR) repeat protein